MHPIAGQPCQTVCRAHDQLLTLAIGPECPRLRRHHIPGPHLTVGEAQVRLDVPQRQSRPVHPLSGLLTSSQHQSSLTRTREASTRIAREGLPVRGAVTSACSNWMTETIGRSWAMTPVSAYVPSTVSTTSQMGGTLTAIGKAASISSTPTNNS